ncbi:ABC transporter substrate-binding protein [Microbacterium soli]|uniref:Extracellular solute-binding protein n=1 Tax=Microbacterium soli TaxID=446075 RepID=A0ABP7N0B4_9MICO
MKHKLAFSLASLTLAALALSACAPSTGGSTGTDAEGDEDVTLTVWSWRTEDADVYNAIFDVFEEANPGITIDLQTFKNSEYTQILTTGLTGTSSSGPDVVQVQAYNRIQPFIEGGNLVPIEDIVDGLDNIDPAALEASLGREDGKIYGVPFATQAIQMFYNKGIFDELGLDEPTTWAEFIDVNEALADGGYTPIAVGAKDDWTLPIVHSALATTAFGGDVFGDEVRSGEKDFTDPGFVQSIQVMKDLQPYMPADVTGVAYTDAQTLFIAEQAGMFPGGSFEINFFTTQNPDLELGMFPVPPVDGSSMSEGVVTGYQDGAFAINAASAKQEAAAKLLSWMTTTEFGQLFTDQTAQPSPVLGVSASDPLLKEILDTYNANPQKYLLYTDFRWGTPAASEIFNPGLQSLLLGDLSAADLAQQVTDGVSQWLTTP